MKIAVCLRGHIRDGLTSSGLRDHILNLKSQRDVQCVHLYCHTWKESEAKLSYRPLDRRVLLRVTPDLIRHYFSQCLDDIKYVKISDDTKIQLIGDVEGKLSASPHPKIAWKRMWAGQADCMNAIVNSGIEYDRVINTRYDMFTTPICITNDILLKRMIRAAASALSFKYPSYTRDHIGVDNYFCGRMEYMNELVQKFHTSLDEIIERFPNIGHQEKLVYLYAKSKRWTAK